MVSLPRPLGILGTPGTPVSHVPLATRRPIEDQHGLNHRRTLGKVSALTEALLVSFDGSVRWTLDFPAHKNYFTLESLEASQITPKIHQELEHKFHAHLLGSYLTWPR